MFTQVQLNLTEVHALGVGPQTAARAQRRSRQPLDFQQPGGGGRVTQIEIELDIGLQGSGNEAEWAVQDQRVGADRCGAAVGEQAGSITGQAPDQVGATCFLRRLTSRIITSTSSPTLTTCEGFLI